MSIALHIGDCRAVLATLPDASVHCVVTSPPYWGLRDYGTATWEGGDPACSHEGNERWYTEQTAATSSAGAFSQPGQANIDRLKKGRWREKGSCTKCGAIHSDAQLGLEPDFNAYVANMVAVFREVRRVLRDDGTLWLNLGDSYAAQRGGTNMPAETLAGGINGKGDSDTHRGRLGGPFDFEKTRHANRQAHRDARSQGLKHKDLCGIPWRVAFALQADGWYLRQDIIWSKPNPMPESVTDRCTKAHEYLFLLSKRERYYYDADAIAEDVKPWNEGKIIGYDGTQKNCETIGDPRFATRITSDRVVGSKRNKRSVWEVTTQPFSEAHFATFPPALIEPCIKAGCPVGGTVLDPFGGAGTTGLVADRLQRNAVLIELNPTYAAMSSNRIKDDAPLFAEVAQP